MKVRYLIISIFLAFLGCKEKNLNKKHSSIQPNAFKTAQGFITDSLLLNNKKNYGFLNLSLYDQQKILSFTYPELELDILDKHGQLIKQVTKKGEGPGELQYFFDIAISDDKIFLLENFNIPRCLVFDLQTLNYIATISFENNETDIYPQILRSCFSVTKQDNSYILSYSGTSLLYDKFNKEYYNNTYAIAEYIVSDEFLIKEFKKHLPLKKFKPLSKHLNEDKIFWDQANLLHKKAENKNIIIPFFTDSIYIYDEKWQLDEKIKIQLENKKNFVTDFRTKKNTNERLAQNFKLRFSNRNYYSVDYFNQKIYLLYPEEIDTNIVPIDIEQYNSFTPNPVLYIIDLKTQQQYKTLLPKRISYFSSFKVINDNTIVIPSNTMYMEDFYLYTVSINTNK